MAITGCPIMTHRHAGRKTAAKVARRLRPSGKARTLSYRAQLMPDAIRTQSGLSAAEIRHAAQNEEVVTLWRSAACLQDGGPILVWAMWTGYALRPRRFAGLGSCQPIRRNRRLSRLCHR